MPGKNKKNKITQGLLHKSKDLEIYENPFQVSESEMEYILEQNPLERIRETVQLILKVFPLNKKKSNTSKIYIDKS